MSTRTSDGERKGILDRLFGIDLRSLAAFRIAAGAIVCVDALGRLPLLTELYTEHGPIYLSPYENTLFSLVGEAWWPGFLLGILAAAGALLCAGKWTRVANVVCWVLLFDLHRRNPHVLDGGDKFLQHMLFWGLFLPLGGAWSLDARRARTVAPARTLSIATAALLLQPASIYFFSALLKAEHPMWREGTAAYYAVAQDIWARPFADWVAARPGTLTKVLTWSTFAAELFCPLLLFSPWKTSLARGVAMVSLIAMQIGFAVSLELNLFPFVSTAAILPFLPAGFWDRFGLARAQDPPPSVSTAAASAARRIGSALGACALVVALLLNLESVLPFPLLPGFVRRGGEVVIAQGWGMYGEIYKRDFDLVVHGLRSDGRRVPIDNGGDGGDGVSFEPVQRLRDDYRAKMYFERLPSLAGEQAMYCTWLKRIWNAGDERPKIDAVELTLVTRLNTLPGEAPARHVSRLMVWPPPQSADEPR